MKRLLAPLVATAAFAAPVSANTVQMLSGPIATSKNRVVNVACMERSVERTVLHARFSDGTSTLYYDNDRSGSIAEPDDRVVDVHGVSVDVFSPDGVIFDRVDTYLNGSMSLQFFLGRTFRNGEPVYGGDHDVRGYELARRRFESADETFADLSARLSDAPIETIANCGREYLLFLNSYAP